VDHATTAPGHDGIHDRIDDEPHHGLLTMLNESFSPSASTRGHRVRELVGAFRPLRDSDGRLVDVPTVVPKDPRTATAVLALLIADPPVEVFGVACVSTKHRLLAWHVLSRGTRAGTPVSMPDVFVPACLTPGTTGLMVVHNHPSGDASATMGSRRAADEVQTLDAEESSTHHGETPDSPVWRAGAL